MTQEEEKLNRLRRERIARTKKILRWLPRKANIHRYPVLRWFAKAAIKRHYFWSFRITSVVPAIWAGAILALLPLYGIQIPLALLLAYMLKANLPVLVGLQAISNPITVIPIYYSAYHVGRLCLFLFGVEIPMLGMGEIRAHTQTAETGSWVTNFAYFGQFWLVMCLGGTILGTFFAAVGSTLYKFSAKEVAISLAKLKELQQKRLAKKEQAES